MSRVKVYEPRSMRDLRKIAYFMSNRMELDFFEDTDFDLSLSILKNTKEDGGLILTARLECTDLAGLVIFDREDSHYTDMLMYVSSGHRRSGLAKRLTNEAIVLARKRGIQELRGRVREDNVPSLRYFESMGFDTNFDQDSRYYQVKLRV